jgi:hypothetical protein
MKALSFRTFCPYNSRQGEPAAFIRRVQVHDRIDAHVAFASASLTLSAVVGHPYRHRQPVRCANPHFHPAIVLERFGPLLHQLRLLGLQGRGIQRLLEVMPDQ